MLNTIASILSGNAGTLIGALIGAFIGIAFILKDSAESNWRKRFRGTEYRTAISF
ncbi:hypothetical protein GCM10007107_06430 [Shewanella indica]|nr:hypothetical protein GCM10007107_06430 [Shewanella indica]